MRVFCIAESAIPSRQANSVQVMGMAEALAGHGHDVTLCVPDREVDAVAGVDDPFIYYGVARTFRLEQTPLGRGPARFSRWGLRAGATAARRGADMVFGRSAAGCLGAALRGARTIFEAHAPPPPVRTLYGSIYGLLMRRHALARIVAVSSPLRDVIAARFARVREKVVVWPSGAREVEETRVRPDWPGRPDALQVGYVGHLYPGKGFELVLALVPWMPDVDFHVVGGEPGEAARRAGRALPGNLHDHGFIAPVQLSPTINRFDVCLLPNQRRVQGAPRKGRRSVDIGTVTSPLKLFEYMAHRKAVAASDLPVLRDVLNEDNAMLVEPESVEAWRAALTRLQDPALRDRLAGQAYRDFRERYTWRRRAAGILEI